MTEEPTVVAEITREEYEGYTILVVEVDKGDERFLAGVSNKSPEICFVRSGATSEEALAKAKRAVDEINEGVAQVLSNYTFTTAA